MSPNSSFCVFNMKVRSGLEHYADHGDIASIASLHDRQSILPAIDSNVPPRREINFGVGAGPVSTTDHRIV